MMKNFVWIFSFILLLFSCGSRKSGTSTVSKPSATTKSSTGLRNLSSNFSGKNKSAVDQLLKDAKKYIGTPYKYAGNTSNGFDCSGLVCLVYAENGKKIPRRSIDQATQGTEIKIHDSKPGDLLFFATSGGNTVSHVGILYEVTSDGEVLFIHSSTSKGVIISSLMDRYWNKAFLFARRLYP